MKNTGYPSFRDPAFLRSQLRRDIAFFDPRTFDPTGGFFHYLNDDGSIYDRHSRHLVNSARMVFCYTLAWRLDGVERYRESARHGLAFLSDKHQQATGGYAWVLYDGTPTDRTQHCYGLAFVLLAQAHALRSSIAITDTATPSNTPPAELERTAARAALERTFNYMEHLFWSETDGLYADEASPDGELSTYRGQNANMHSCEALIAAYEASGSVHFLHRAERIAHTITQDQAGLANGWIWEHYHSDWNIDWEYNRHDQSNMFRPWGYQPGHMTEWAKLLLLLERHAPQLQHSSDWLLPKAQELFDLALTHAWDHTHGGIVYGLAPDLQPCDSDKYFWVQAESLATAALLGQRTGDQVYWDWYEKIWRYSWDHLIDHQHGAWFRVLTPDNHPYGSNKPPHGKTDFYHPMGAYLEALYANGAQLEG